MSDPVKKKSPTNTTSMKKANPIISGLIGIANTGLSIIRDKKAQKSQVTIHDEIKEGINLSSKKIVGYGLGGTIIVFALDSLKVEVNPPNLWMLGIGAALTLGTEIIVYFSEKKDKNKPE